MPLAAAAAAAAAAACKSFRDAFPRFFRSRAYSHFNAKSKSPEINLSKPVLSTSSPEKNN
jgi:hypothetical protein